MRGEALLSMLAADACHDVAGVVAGMKLDHAVAGRPGRVRAGEVTGQLWAWRCSGTA